MQKPRPFSAKRTESDMLAMAPITVRLGKSDYEIPVLNNKSAAKWREKLFEALAPLVGSFDFGSINLNEQQETISRMMSAKLSQELIAFPVKLGELLLAYAPMLAEGDILGEASDEQIGLAFSAVAEVGYPFFFHLWATKRALAIPLEDLQRTQSVLQ